MAFQYSTEIVKWPDCLFDLWSSLNLNSLALCKLLASVLDQLLIWKFLFLKMSLLRSFSCLLSRRTTVQAMDFSAFYGSSSSVESSVSLSVVSFASDHSLAYSSILSQLNFFSNVSKKILCSLHSNCRYRCNYSEYHSVFMKFVCTYLAGHCRCTCFYGSDLSFLRGSSVNYTSPYASKRLTIWRCLSHGLTAISNGWDAAID